MKPRNSLVRGRFPTYSSARRGHDIEGVKRFISGGDLGDTVDNILHLVLARPVGARSGTKGLSLFVVPKHLFDWDNLEITGRNGVFATGLEHKMGYKASPTCATCLPSRSTDRLAVAPAR